MPYSNIPSQTREMLLDTARTEYERLTCGGYQDQLNASVLVDVIEMLEGMTRTQAYKLGREIDRLEKYDPAADKWGFGPVEISPLNWEYTNSQI